MFTLIGVFVFAYLVGSIPFGLLLTKAAGLGDIRTIGSGNIGATNVLRAGNKKLAVLTMALDIAKGAVAVLVAQLLAPDSGSVAALGAVLGHMFPVWLKFKGGKGVATGCGVVAALSWPTALTAYLIWLVIAIGLRLSSLAALVAALSVPFLLVLFGDSKVVPVALVIIALLIFKHRANIKRLITRTEPKIDLNPKNGSTPTH